MIILNLENKLAQNFYRENIFGILLENLRKIEKLQEVTMKIEVILKIIHNLEKIIDEEKENKDLLFHKQLEKNLLNIMRYQSIYSGKSTYDFIKKVTALNNQSSRNDKQILSKIFRYTEEYVNIEYYVDKIYNVIKDKFEKGQNIVFLSYAYSDNLYTIGLFYYFLSKNIYLYVDWLNNNKIENGKILKRSLSKELKKANQFLFLDTLSSQFQVSGNWLIRQWCAWEIGVYNRLKEYDDKYYLTIYDETKTDKRLQKNLLLHDFKPLTDVENGTLK